MRREVAFLFIGVLSLAATQATAAEPCRTVHGRMAVWNGAPAVRISVAGTHHVLGVAHRDGDPEETPELPPDLAQTLTSAGLGGEVVGDFRVCPLTKAKSGRLEMVRVTGADHLTVVLQGR